MEVQGPELREPMYTVVLAFAGAAYTLLFFDLQAREVSRAGTA